jgi:5'/3'-nucleotidase
MNASTRMYPGTARVSRLFLVTAVLAAVLGGAASLQQLHAQGPPTYRILVTNDDGVRAPGLAALVEALAPLGELTVVAPLDNHSGTGHALTMVGPIYADRVPIGEATTATALAATPATCVRLALGTLMEQRPDLVVSGVNRGNNFGLNAYISGTVAAAREAAMQGIPAIASSLDFAGHPNYGAAAAATARVAGIVKAGGLSRGVFLNVNVPAAPADRLKGLKLVRQSSQMGQDRFEESRTPYGRRLYWSLFVQPETAEPETDVQAVLDGYIAVTPLVASEFDAKEMEKLKGRF